MYLRGHRNIIKRLLIHACSLNLGLLMRNLYGVGTPRRLQDGGLQSGFLLLFVLELLLNDPSRTSSRHPGALAEDQAAHSLPRPYNRSLLSLN